MTWTTPVTWVDGAEVDASDLNEQVRDNLDYLYDVGVTPAQSTQTGTGASAYTFALTDLGGILLANAATSASYTIPPQASVAWPGESVLRVVSIGAGVITFAGGSGVTVTNTAATLAQYEAATLIRTGSNAWTVVKGGGLPKASVSATTGSPGVDTSSRPGKTIYNFTGSGSVTVDKAGLVEHRILGAGGGGGHYAGGGGGAGGHFESTRAWLDVGTHTVTVGGGGAGGAVGGAVNYGRSGSASRVGPYMAAGGGGGAYVAREGFGGGSGGGSGVNTASVGIGFAPQGNAGGTGSSSNYYAGGGGGAGAAGANGSGTVAGAGGAGVASSITGSSVTYCGGGGGGTDGGGSAGAGGTGGGGAGSTTTTGTAGTANTGGGGGGAGGTTAAGGAGGSGRVIIVIG
jgi:hypothetical protein